MNRRLLTVLPAVALAVSLAACSDSDDDAADTSVPSSTSAAPTTSAADDTDEPGGDTTEDPMTMPGHPDIRIIPGTGDTYTGSWRDPDGGAIINFADDGTLTGTDGCNNFQSTWTLDSGSGGEGSVAIVEPFPATKMACSGPWSPWILSMHEVHHEGDRLSVTNEGGTELGELIPADPA